MLQLEQASRVNQELGRKEGMTSAYGIMGNIYQIRDDLDKAEEVWTKSLYVFK